MARAGTSGARSRRGPRGRGWRLAGAWLTSRAWLVGVLLGLPYPGPVDAVRDVEFVYLPWARALADGAVPYRDFALEYPPLVLPLLLLPDDPAAARLVFGAVGLLLDAAVLLLLRRGVSQASAWTWVLAAPLLGPVWFARLDLPVALACVGSSLLWQRRAWTWLGVVAVVGAGLKLWPVLLLVLPLLTPGADRRRLLAGAAGAAAALGSALVLWGAWPAVLDVVRYHLRRGLEVEAVAAAPLAVLSGPLGLEDMFRFGAHELVGRGVGAALALSAAASVVALALLARAARRGAPPELLVAGLACAVLVTAKVGSPQYLVWGVAAVAAALPRLSRPRSVLLPGAVLLAAAQLVYPLLFGSVVAQEPVGAYLLVVRSAALLAVAAAVWRAFDAAVPQGRPGTTGTGTDAGGPPPGGDGPSVRTRISC